MNNWYIPLPLRLYKSPETKALAYELFNQLKDRNVETIKAMRIVQSKLAGEYSTYDLSKYSQRELDEKEKKEREEKELLDKAKEIKATEITPTPVVKNKQPKSIQPSLGLGMFWDE